MIKFTYHSLRRAKERGLSLDAIAEKIVSEYVKLHGGERTRLLAEDMTVVATKEGNEAVVITAWKNN